MLSNNPGRVNNMNIIALPIKLQVLIPWLSSSQLMRTMKRFKPKLIMLPMARVEEAPQEEEPRPLLPDVVPRSRQLDLAFIEFSFIYYTLITSHSLTKISLQLIIVLEWLDYLQAYRYTCYNTCIMTDKQKYLEVHIVDNSSLSYNKWSLLLPRGLTCMCSSCIHCIFLAPA